MVAFGSRRIGSVDDYLLEGKSSRLGTDGNSDNLTEWVIVCDLLRLGHIFQRDQLRQTVAETQGHTVLATDVLHDRDKGPTRVAKGELLFEGNEFGFGAHDREVQSLADGDCFKAEVFLVERKSDAVGRSEAFR